MNRDMKRLFFISLLLIVSLPVFAQSLTEQADSAYTSDEFELASQLYSKAMEEDGSSAEILYNLGNCYYRLGKPGKAILMYERALRLEPTFTDARDNLIFVNSKITDRPGERGTFLNNAMDEIALKAHSNTWAALAAGFFLLTVAGIMLYIFSDNITLRKTGFFGGIVSLILCAGGLFLAFRGASIATDTQSAIILSPSTILSTAPRTPSDRSMEAMLLHEGTKVEILDSVQNRADSIPSLWLDVRVDNTHRAWVKASDVERI